MQIPAYSSIPDPYASLMRSEPRGKEHDDPSSDRPASINDQKEAGIDSVNSVASTYAPELEKSQPKDAESRRANGQPLSEEDQQRVEELKSRDREVRAHENAHKAAAGSYARGGPKFDYEKGPDGRQYAVGGHVDIDVSPVAGDPEATIRKMQVVQQAALAPGEPSGQDRQVAAAAAREAQNARAELQKQRADQRSPETSAGSQPSRSAEAQHVAQRYAEPDSELRPGTTVDLLV